MKSENEESNNENPTQTKTSEILHDYQIVKEKQFVNLIAKIIVDIAFQRAYEKSN